MSERYVLWDEVAAGVGTQAVMVSDGGHQCLWQGRGLENLDTTDFGTMTIRELSELQEVFPANNHRRYVNTVSEYRRQMEAEQ